MNRKLIEELGHSCLIWHPRRNLENKAPAALFDFLWHDIEGDFVVRGTPFGWEVAYRLTEAFKKFQKIAAQSASRGAFESVGNCFEMPTAEVAELLNQHKRQAAGSR